MKKKITKKDLFQLSKTLYGRERAKLVISTIKEYQVVNKEYTAEDLHFIDIAFDTTEESDDYRRIILDFYVMNFVLFPMLVEAFNQIKDLLSVLSFENDNDLCRLSDSISSYFKLAVVIEDVNREYSFDLFLVYQRNTLSAYEDVIFRVITIIQEHGIVFNVQVDNFKLEDLSQEKALVKQILRIMRSIALITF